MTKEKPVTTEAVDVSAAEYNRGIGTEHRVSISQSYYNHGRTPVIVVDRHGLKYVVPPCGNTNLNKVIIRVKIEIIGDVNINSTDLLDNSSMGSSVLLDVLSANQRPLSFTNGFAKTYEVDYAYSFEEIESKGNSVYLKNLDIVLSTLSPFIVPFHPYSEKGCRSYAIKAREHVNTNTSLGYNIVIADSQGVFGEKFVNINGRAYKVPVDDSGEMADGVWLISSGEAKGHSNVLRPIFQRYDFQDAEKELGLYKSVEEALTLGDLISAKEAEIKEVNHEIKKLEAELKKRQLETQIDHAKIQHDLDKEKRERDRDKERNDWELEKRKRELEDRLEALEHQRRLERDQMKHDYDKEKQRRSNFDSILKFALGAATTVLGIYALYLKIHSSK
ncbi:MAG: hypothetical protein IBX57_00760 [Gammaproteobacteria bacterium]|nr:hypothetical protein [Gammaproteobacteria bacterium]